MPDFNYMELFYGRHSISNFLIWFCMAIGTNISCAAVLNFNADRAKLSMSQETLPVCACNLFRVGMIAGLIPVLQFVVLIALLICCIYKFVTNVYWLGVSTSSSS